MPLDTVRSNFNYSTDQKRVLNFEHVVSESDNIKQDMSIDVYGRQDKEESNSSRVRAMNFCLPEQLHASSSSLQRVSGRLSRVLPASRTAAACRLLPARPWQLATLTHEPRAGPGSHCCSSSASLRRGGR